MRVLIYGANGFTGQLIVERCQTSSLQPIIAGRSENKIEELADTYQLEYRVFHLDDEVNIIGQLQDIDIVLHCAGPFETTGKPMINACLASNTHYLDISGELSIFELCQKRSAQAQAQDILLMPGCGFDIIPTENLAAMMHDQFPEGKNLEIGINGMNNPSKGTIRSALSSIPNGSKIRKDGKLVSIPYGSKSKEFVFLDGQTRKCVAVPLPDLIATNKVTKIDNIEVYFSMKSSQTMMVKLSRPFMWFLRYKLIRRMVQAIAGIFQSDPTEKIREEDIMQVKAVLSDGKKRIVGDMETPNPYDFTADATINALEKLVDMEQIPKGFHTPSEIFGNEFVLQCNDVKVSISGDNRGH